MAEDIPISNRFSIPGSEIEIQVSRSGGPGGQHANTSSTRVQLRWNVRESRTLSEGRREILLDRLSGRIDNEGVLQITAGTHRSQHQNRQEARDRLASLVTEALRPRKKRKKTRRPRSANEKRLKEKKQRGRTKSLRGSVRRDEQQG